jgi:hypothetical protein
MVFLFVGLSFVLPVPITRSAPDENTKAHPVPIRELLFEAFFLGRAPADRYAICHAGEAREVGK